MSLTWKAATDVSTFPQAHHFLPPDDEKPGDEIHEEHRLHPWLRAAGFGESPCTYLGCPAYDEDHDDALERAYGSHGEVETHAPGSIHLHGFEKVVDPATVLRYMNHPPDKAPPRVFTHRGQHHIFDGHHRLLADTMAGRPLTFEHSYVDED